MANVAERIAHVQGRIAAACGRGGRDPATVTLVAVTKTFPVSLIREAASLGLRHFGENRVQEARDKIPQCADLDVEWHLIGSLQSNKTNLALQLFDVIHSVHSRELAEQISARVQRRSQYADAVSVLLEVNVSRERSKHGFSPEELRHEALSIARLPGVTIRGLMTVAPVVSDVEEIRPVFRSLRHLLEELKPVFQAHPFRDLSMGMSQDFEVALEEGATLIRLGTALFGPRQLP
ncbi:MAG: YggS family pyridoxal phosphate-dependent enzyme [Chloroflexi bacterium]|nr:YggS family pyridoxal phosphate-dependent enzyme [Chloroflexota bacterium]